MAVSLRRVWDISKIPLLDNSVLTSLRRREKSPIERGGPAADRLQRDRLKRVLLPNILQDEQSLINKAARETLPV